MTKIFPHLKDKAEVGTTVYNDSSPHTDPAGNAKPGSKPVLRTPNLDQIDNGKPKSRSGKKIGDY